MSRNESKKVWNWDYSSKGWVSRPGRLPGWPTWQELKFRKDKSRKLHLLFWRSSTTEWSTWSPRVATWVKCRQVALPGGPPDARLLWYRQRRVALPGYPPARISSQVGIPVSLPGQNFSKMFQSCSYNVLGRNTPYSSSKLLFASDFSGAGSYPVVSHPQLAYLCGIGKGISFSF